MSEQRTTQRTQDGAEAPQNGWGETRYIAHIRVSVRRQTIEAGYSLDDFEDRKAAVIVTEELGRDFRQVEGSALSDVLPTVDTAELLEDAD